jgi:hypothetical protein
MDLAIHRTQYHRDGFTVISDVLPNPKRWQNAITTSQHLRRVFTPEKERVVAAGEGFNLHVVLDRFDLDAALPEAADLYNSVFDLILEVVDPGAIRSPFARSAYYAKGYDPPNGQQGWHFDTNDISGILYLTDNENDGATVITSLFDGSINRIAPVAGSLLLLQGTKCWHMAEPVTDNPKCTCLLNYYLGTPPDRHPALDGIIFGAPPQDHRGTNLKENPE